MFQWIWDLPNIGMAALFCGACLLFAWAGLLAVRPVVRRWLGAEPAANDMVGRVFTVFGSFYGLTLGLVAINASQTYTAAAATVEREAATIAALYRDVSVLPEPARGRLQGHLRGYVRELVDMSWPAQRRGLSSDGDVPIADALHVELTDFIPKDRRQEVLHAEALRQYNTFVDARFSRMAHSGHSLPAVLWAVVIAGAMLVLSVQWLFVSDKLSVHLLLSGVFSVFLGLMLFFVAARDYPFRGEEHISPAPYELVHDRLMSAGTKP